MIRVLKVAQVRYTFFILHFVASNTRTMSKHPQSYSLLVQTGGEKDVQAWIGPNGYSAAVDLDVAADNAPRGQELINPRMQ